MRAITLHQPWATAIADLGKDIENRTWRPPANVIGTRIAIHAGSTFDEPGARGVMQLCPGVTMHWLMSQPRGAVLATAILHGVVTESESPWFGGPFGWRLVEIRRLTEPVKARGAQGLWTLPADVERLVLARQVPLEGALDS